MNKPLNKYFDHTLLKADSTHEEIKTLCDEARKYDFYSVCVNGCYVKYASDNLKGSDVKVATVIGFPLGATLSETKVFETVNCCENGASEIDMVINIGALKECRDEYIVDEITAVVSAADDYDAIVKVIIETSMLTREEIKRACELAISAGAAFVKTSTGFSKGGATKEDVALMKECVMNFAEVKASGGIRTLETALEMIEAGADRIGASASVQIMEEYKKSMGITT